MEEHDDRLDRREEGSADSGLSIPVPSLSDSAVLSDSAASVDSAVLSDSAASVDSAVPSDSTAPVDGAALEQDPVNEALGKLGTSLDELASALNGVARGLENLREGRRAYARVTLGAAVLLPVSLLGQIVLSVVLNTVMPGWDDTWLYWAASFAPLYLLATPLALRVMGRVPALPPKPRSVGPLRMGALFLVCVFLTYGGGLISVGILRLLHVLLGTSADNPLNGMVLNETAPLLRDAVMVLFAPAVEEYVFRRAVLDRLRVYGEKPAVLTSALMFALIHGNVSQSVYAFLLGCLFGWLYLRTGRLRYTVILHSAVNFMGGVLAARVVEYGEELGTLVLGAYGILILLLCGGGIAVLADNWRHIRFVPAERELPPAARLRTALWNPGMGILFLCSLISTVLVLRG